MSRIIFAVALSLSLAGAGAFASDAGMAVPVSVPAAAQGIALVKLVFALAAVLATFWVFARVMRRLNGGAMQSSAGLSIVGALSLGQREKLVVVQAGGQQIVLGVTAQSINRLHVLDVPLEPPPRADIQDFRTRLQAALGRQAS